jgi:hypothetical protein
VHQAGVAVLLLVAGLSAALVYLVALAAFGSRDSAVWAGAGYAFLPLWGSLDYLRWGGLPNALGMNLLCLAVFLLLSTYSAPERRVRTTAILSAAICFPALLLVHHYSALVACLVFAAGLLACATAPLRRHLLFAAGAAAVLSAPLVVSHYLTFAGGLDRTSVLVFREPLLPLWTCIRGMNPLFVAAVVVSLWLARRCAWNAQQVFVLAWMTALLAAFVLLEYVYRAGALLATAGQDCFTALTPSRMATDMVYPMSILLGFIPRGPSWPRYHPLWNAGLWALSGLTAVMIWSMQRDIGVHPDLRDAGAWLRNNTPADTMLVGRFPHVEYLTWRETTVPCLPASEERLANAVTWKRQFQYFDDWIDWSRRSGRPVTFLRTPGAAVPPYVRPVFRNRSVAVYAPVETEAP